MRDGSNAYLETRNPRDGFVKTGTPFAPNLGAGGANLTDFRLRVAQSHVRNDLLPSFWSHVAIVESAKSVSPMEWKLDEVRLDPLEGFGNVAANNGVQQSSFRRYDDPGLFPNIGIVNFHVDAELIKESKDKFRSQRNLIDVPGLMVDWLAYAWGVADRGNPLLKAVGIPSASFVEGVFAIAGLDLTPGLSARSSCPEASSEVSATLSMFRG